MVKMPFTPSVKEEAGDTGDSKKKLSPAMDAAIKRRMKLMGQNNQEEDVVNKTKKVGY